MKQSQAGTTDSYFQNYAMSLFKVENRKIGDAEVLAFARRLQDTPTAEHILFESNELGAISDASAQVLAEVLSRNRRLNCFTFKNNRVVDNTGVRLLEKIFQMNTNLKAIFIEDNFTFFADGSLDELSGEPRPFWHKGIGAMGMQVLLDVCQRNTSLRRLHLRGNRFGDVGVRALADALRENTKLQDLDLSDNSIGSEGVKALSSAFRNNYALTKLCLNENEIDDEDRNLRALLLLRNTGVREVKEKLKAFIIQENSDSRTLKNISTQCEALRKFVKEESLPPTHYFSELHRLSSAILSLQQAASFKSSVLDEIKCYENVLSLLIQSFDHPGLQRKAHNRLKDCLVQLLRLTADYADKRAAYATLLAYHLRHNRQDLAFGIAMNALDPKIDIAPSLEKFMIFDDLVIIAKKVLKALEEKQKTADASQSDSEQKEIEILAAIITQGNYHHAAVTALLSLPSFIKELDVENIKILYLLEACLIDPSREDAMNYSLGLEQDPKILFEYLTGVAEQHAVEIQKPDRFKEILDEAKRVAVPNLNLEEKTDSPMRGVGIFDRAASSSANSNSFSVPRPR